MNSDTKAENIYICHKGGDEVYGLWLDLCDCGSRVVEDDGPVCYDNIETVPDPDDPECVVEEPQPCDAHPHLCTPADEAREDLISAIVQLERYRDIQVGLGLGVAIIEGIIERFRALLALIPKEENDGSEV